jgi:hypothetical protein
MRDKRLIFWVIFGLCLLLCAGCDQSVDTGSDSAPPDAGPADTVAGDGETTADGTAGEKGVADGPPAGQTVKVIYKGQTTVVSLSQPTPIAFENTPHAKLSDVIEIAVPGAAQDALTADFTSSDGYQPGSKSNCDGMLPVAGTEFAKGYIDVATRMLSWDPGLNYPGCLFVKDLAEIEVADK